MAAILEVDHLQKYYGVRGSVTRAINDLKEEFDENDSEVETVARESIAVTVRDILGWFGIDIDTETALRERLSHTQGRLQALGQVLEKEEAQEREQKEQLRQAMLESGFTTREQYTAALARGPELERLRQQVEDHRTMTVSVEANLRTLGEELAGKAPPALPELEAEETALRRAEAEQRESYTAAASALALCRRSWEELRQESAASHQLFTTAEHFGTSLLGQLIIGTPFAAWSLHIAWVIGQLKLFKRHFL